MPAPDTPVWLVSGYSLLLLAIAWAFDAMAQRVSHRATQWRTGKFVYHADHDAWVCPEDQLLWPTSFDPANRVMRYRASPSVCNACPVKSSCTTSDHGREMTREIDPWPHSEAGRFHRGVACFIAALGVLMPMVVLVASHSVTDVLVLAGVAVVVALAGLPLARHLWNTPSNAPEHFAHRSGAEDEVAAAIDRYSTRWGGFADRPVETGERAQ